MSKHILYELNAIFPKVIASDTLKCRIKYGERPIFIKKEAPQNIKLHSLSNALASPVTGSINAIDLASNCKGFE